ncbi:hypothetical protein Purlil1_13601 [Purpureocillium lilacinum]|uniref:HAT C-terminal dimerisation domain-containing protein n=1 Tax=Purpureocillium lilacinum TaxID=33203 RepID=A0ABR0BDX4_PURLI|nr:hypothetical protein Purlil1_13601 [Purpureocillium lilacinum]
MLRTALSLRDAIDGYFSKWMEADCVGDELSAEDWITLEKIESFLEKLKMTTKALESSFATLDNVLLAMDFMLAQFESGKEAHVDDATLAPMYNSGWAKLDKYYRLTDESPAYVAAIVLHPSHKWHYINENWKKEWAESSKKLIDKLWDEYKPVELPLPLEGPPTTTNEFLNWRNKHLRPALSPDEYERYCKSERVYGFTSALAWWLEETQQKNYPSLSKMAVDILSIPAMSAEPERLFSGAKITITDRRNRLGSDVVEALECLKSWFGIRGFQADGITCAEQHWQTLTYRLSTRVGQVCAHEVTVIMGVVLIVGLLAGASAMKWTTTGQLLCNIPPSIIESFFMMILITGHNLSERKRREDYNNLYQRRLDLYAYINCIKA